MASVFQLRANRENAQHSTGPVTEEGKAHSSRNHTSHALSAKNFRLLPNEDPAEFEYLLTGHIHSFNPQTPFEEILVRHIVEAEWKLLRIDRMEAEVLEQHDNPFLEAIDNKDSRTSVELSRLDRYRTSTRRNMHAAHETLRRAIRDRQAQARDNSNPTASTSTGTTASAAGSNPAALDELARALESVPAGVRQAIFEALRAASSNSAG